MPFIRPAAVPRLLLVLLLLPAGSVSALTPAPPGVPARAYILMDAQSGYVIADRQPDLKVEPASLTKIMTVYIAAEELAADRLALDDEAQVSAKAWKTGGSRMFIQVDSKVSVRDLLKGIIVQSGNDASVALAEHIAGAEEVFASMMNKAAAEIGMEGTNFANATGLPHPDTFTTARDMALLTQAFVARFPEIYGWFREKEFTYNDIRQANRNRLLFQDDSVDGVKTGHTESAGYCLVASAARDGMRLISVVVGTDSDAARTEASRSLLEYGFRFFETRRVYAAAQPVASRKVWKGRSREVGLGFANDLYLTFPRGRYQDIEVNLDTPTEFVAPIEAGRTIGTASFVLDDEPLASKPLVAVDGVARAGFVRRLIDGVKMMIW